MPVLESPRGRARLRGLRVGAVVPAGGGGGAAGALSHRLKGLHVLEAAALVEALQRGHDALGVDLVHLFPAKAQLLHVAGADVLDKDVSVFQKGGQHLSAFGVFHVQGKRFLVGVELQEVQRVAAVHVVHLTAGGIAAVYFLQLDNFCAHPGQHLSAGGAGLHLGPVNYLNTGQRGR